MILKLLFPQGTSRVLSSGAIVATCALAALLLFACQSPIPSGGTKTHSITYDGNGKTGGSVPVDSKSYSVGDTVTVLDNTGNLSRLGYSFGNWNTQTDGNGTTYSPAATFWIGPVDVTLYARWIAQSWSQVDTPDFSAGQADYTSLALDSGGSPYVAYEDATASTANAVSVMKFDGTSWVQVGSSGFSAGTSQYVSLGIDGSDTPYVAYEDAAASTPNAVSVMKYSSGSWTQVGTAGFSPGAGTYESLAIDSGGTPYVAFSDAMATTANAVSVMKFNGASWAQVGSEGFSAGAANYISLAISSGGTPYVAYQDGATGPNHLSVMKFNGSSWVQVGSAGFSAGAASNVSLAIADSGTPYVAFTDGSSSGKASVMKFNGSSWVQVGAAGFAAGNSQYVSLALDSTGVPYVAYQDWGTSHKATVMKLYGGSWVQVGSAGITPGIAAYTSVALDANGTVYVAYEDQNDASKRASVMQYR